MGGFIFRINIVAVLTVLLFGGIEVNAQGEKEKRRTSINFEDELIEGGVNKPELLYLMQRKQFNFKRLIKLRENFLPEMRRTGEDLQRGRD